MNPSALVAWDSVRQKAAWTIEKNWPWNGGTLATGGNAKRRGWRKSPPRNSRRPG